MSKAQKARIDRINARPFITTYPATGNCPELHVLTVPKGATRKQILRVIDLLPNVIARELP